MPEDEQVEDIGDDGKRQTNVCQQHSDRERCKQDKIQQQKNNQDEEIQRRITAGWTAFAEHRDIFKGNTEHAGRDKYTTHTYFQQ